MIKVIKASSKDQLALPQSVSFFLAGSIERQAKISKAISSKYFNNRFDKATIYSPSQQVDGQESKKCSMKKQMKWELKALDQADIILMSLDASRENLALIEIGLYARSGKLFVVCEDTFCKRDTVKAIADIYNIPLLLYTPMQQRLSTCLARWQALSDTIKIHLINTQAIPQENPHD